MQDWIFGRRRIGKELKPMVVIENYAIEFGVQMYISWSGHRWCQTKYKKDFMRGTPCERSWEISHR
jgi:hypothetical protein